MKYLIVSDYHLSENKRIEDFVKNLKVIEKYSQKVKPDYYINCGDIFDKRHPSPLELKIFANHLYNIRAVKKLFVVGNHDKVALNLTTLSWVKCGNVEIKPYFEIEDKGHKLYLAHRTLSEAKLGPKEIHINGISYKKLKYDIIICGHVHKPQILSKKPLVLIPGSIERINFGERNEEKFIWLLNIKKNKIKLTNHPLPCRPMFYIEYNLDNKSVLVNDKKTNKYEIKDSILKIKFIGKKETLRKINYDKLIEKFKSAYSVNFLFEYSNKYKEKRNRIEEYLVVKSFNDINILKKYCKERKISKDIEDKARSIIKV